MPAILINSAITSPLSRKRKNEEEEDNVYITADSTVITADNTEITIDQVEL